MKFELKDYEMLKKAMNELCSFLESFNVSEESIFNSKLVTSELVSNVFQHAGEIAFLSGEIVDGKICIQVKSKNAYRPPEECVCSDVYAESGRGLYIVDRVSERRSFTRDGAICVVVKTNYKE